MGEATSLLDRARTDLMYASETKPLEAGADIGELDCTVPKVPPLTLYALSTWQSP